MPKNSDKERNKYRNLLEENAPEACEACGGSLLLDEVNLEDYQGGKLYMMEKVAAYVCQECGEIWVPEPIMQEFEKMIATAKDIRKNKPKKGGDKNDKN